MRIRLIENLSTLGLPSWVVPDFWFMLTLAIVCGCLLTLHLWRRAGEEPGRAADLLFWGIPSLFAGTKIFYFLQYGFPLRLDGFWRPQGFALYGGLGGLLLAWVICYRLRPYRAGLFLDCVAPSLGLGLFLGRIGCFLAGCNGGTPTGTFLGVSFPPDTAVFRGQLRAGLIDRMADQSLPVHPTQLYEAIFGLLSCWLLLWLFDRSERHDGQILPTGLLWYSIFRFFSEYLRADSGGWHPLGWLTFSQMVSLVLATVALPALLYVRGLSRPAAT